MNNYLFITFVYFQIFYLYAKPAISKNLKEIYKKIYTGIADFNIEPNPFTCHTYIHLYKDWDIFSV